MSQLLAKDKGYLTVRGLVVRDHPHVTTYARHLMTLRYCIVFYRHIMTFIDVHMETSRFCDDL